MFRKKSNGIVPTVVDESNTILEGQFNNETTTPKL